MIRSPSLRIISARHTHYDTLGVHEHTTPEAIRAAYRELARRVHPDRAAGEANGHDTTMADVNEAYRVLSDPGRRLMYDRSLRSTGSAPGVPPGSPYAAGDADGDLVEPPPVRHSALSPSGPARVPWRLMGIVASLGSAVVLVSSLFDSPPTTQPPDGVLQLGSCIAFEPNGDAREIACTGTPSDVVVEVMVPLDGACRAGSTPHRDRLGMFVVCLTDA